MKLTKQFIMDHRTKNGAWTREQLRIIGVNWPPVKGWQSLIAGKELTLAEEVEFIRAKDKPVTGMKTLDKAYLCVMKNVSRLSKGQLVILRDEINKTL